jgi:hypothetical protein
MTIDQWNNTINSIEYVKSRIKLSDIPSKEVTFINDSLFANLQKEFFTQISKQLAEEQAKFDFKKDSTKPKKN